jgi:hypothetical protein
MTNTNTQNKFDSFLNKNPYTHSITPESPIKFQESPTKSPESPTKFPEPRTKSPESSTKFPEPRTKLLESPTKSSDSPILLEESSIKHSTLAKTSTDNDDMVDSLFDENMDKPDMDESLSDKSYTDKPDMDKPDMGKLDTDKKDMDKTDTDKSYTDKPDMDINTSIPTAPSLTANDDKEDSFFDDEEEFGTDIKESTPINTTPIIPTFLATTGPLIHTEKNGVFYNENSIEVKKESKIIDILEEKVEKDDSFFDDEDSVEFGKDITDTDKPNKFDTDESDMDKLKKVEKDDSFYDDEHSVEFGKDITDKPDTDKSYKESKITNISEEKDDSFFDDEKSVEFGKDITDKPDTEISPLISLENSNQNTVSIMNILEEEVEKDEDSAKVPPLEGTSTPDSLTNIIEKEMEIDNNKIENISPSPMSSQILDVSIPPLLSAKDDSVFDDEDSKITPQNEMSDTDKSYKEKSYTDNSDTPNITPIIDTNKQDYIIPLSLEKQKNKVQKVGKEDSFFDDEVSVESKEHSLESKDRSLELKEHSLELKDGSTTATKLSIRYAYMKKYLY